MKVFNFTIVCALIFFNASCGMESSADSGIEAMNTIKQFYTLYNAEWTSSRNPYEKKHILDSITYKFCTKELVTQIREPDLEHDLFIKDVYTTPEYLNTISVSRDSTSLNTFIVTYKAPLEDPQGKEYIDTVTIYVSVINLDGTYKISAIK